MDGNTSDLISNLLSDPESLKTLASIAKGLMSGGGKNETVQASEEAKVENPKVQEKAEETSDTRQKSTPASSDLLPASIIKPQGTGSHSFDDRANLLKALKPYLKGDRLDRVDSLVKAIGVAKLINTYTGGNLFSK